ncbi:hypothetical protein ACIRVK_40045 [Streptomyces sp. NPDC101152]|uniref:hypothetical protein n=1 Tax=Streptomyces sp. NPDC101152 TaxID=3366116 RepID=UPI0038086482
MRQGLGLLRPGDEIAVDLGTLTARRPDLANDRTRQTNLLRAQLLEFFTAVERVLNLSKKGLVMLLIGYQTPAAIRRDGARRIGTTGARRSRRRLTVQGCLRLMPKGQRDACACATPRPRDPCAAQHVRSVAR